MTTPNNGPCKRRYARFETCFQGTLYGPDGAEPVVCNVIDISLVGARLLTDQRICPGDGFVLEFQGWRRRIVRTPVHVRRSDLHEETGRYLSGLQLTPASFEDRRAIAEFVSRVFQGQAGR